MAAMTTMVAASVVHLLGLQLLFASLGACVHPLIVQGSQFVDSVTKDRFTIIGVDYQPGGSSGYNAEAVADPLSDGNVCLRDAAIMQQLGINTIRVYNVNPLANHEMCASIFNTAGIYMLLDVNSPLVGESLNRDEPWTTYYDGYLSRIFSVVEAFKNYPNTLGFFGGNEVINDVKSGNVVPPYLRAVNRDLKNYIAKHSSRTIPVGYSAADVRDILQVTWAYLQCNINGTANDPSRADFFGLNSYSWCGGDATYKSATYDQLTAMFEKTSVPVFFSEYGCNLVTPRVFNEVQSLYGTDMAGVFSGGLVYEYSEEPSNYGLVNINSNGSVTLLTDFDNIQAQYNKIDLSLLTKTSSAASAVTPPACSSSLISVTGFYNKFDIPVLPPGGQALIDNGAKNFTAGKLVPVPDLKIPNQVISTNGGVINGLTIVTLKNDASNAPSGKNTSGSVSGGSKASGTSPATPSTSKKGTAVRSGVAWSMFGMVVGTAFIWYL